MVDGTSVAIVGAGPAGLIAAQALGNRDIPFTVYESATGVGGNWRYGSDSGRSSCYASLRTNTSVLRTSFACLRLRGRPDAFAGHAQMLGYLERLTDHFALRPQIRFARDVLAVRRGTDGGWDVTSAPSAAAGPQASGSRPATVRHRAVVVASGYNAVARAAVLPGTFDGLQMHTHDYRTPAPFAGLDTVVLGAGSSAVELACELSRHARSVTLAPRSSTHVTGRRVGPLPVDWIDSKGNSALPWALRRLAFGPLTRAAAGGDPVDHGFPAPPRRTGDKPIAVSDDLVPLLARGALRTSAPVVGLAGDQVVLADGATLAAQAILHGTGYEVAHGFLDPADADLSTASVPLYRGVAAPQASGLFFVGLVGAHGALMPMMEAQAGWIARVLDGTLALPGPDVMRTSVAADRRVRARDFRQAPDYWWDRVRYCRALEREAAGAARRPGPARRAAAATLR